MPAVAETLTRMNVLYLREPIGTTAAETASLGGHLPGDYPGFVIGVRKRPFSRADTAEPRRAVVKMDLTHRQIERLRTHWDKVDPATKEIVPEIFEDRHGCTGAKLRADFDDPDDMDRFERAPDSLTLARAQALAGPFIGVGVPPKSAVREREIGRWALTRAALYAALPEMERHTGAQRYRVDDDGATTNDTVGSFDPNILLNSERLDLTANWTATDIAVADVSSPVNPMTGFPDIFELNDSSAAQVGNLNQAATVANDALARRVRVVFKAGSSSIAALAMFYSGGTAKSAGLVVNLADGTTTNMVTGITTNPGASGVTDLGGGWYLVWMNLANNATGNTTLTIRFYSAWAASLTGTSAATSIGSIYLCHPDCTQTATLGNYRPTRASGESTIVLGTGGLTPGALAGQHAVINGHNYPVIQNGVDSVLVAGNATGEALLSAIAMAPYTSPQSAFTQEFTDQSTAALTAKQHFIINAGPYAENPVFNPTAKATEPYGIFIEGNPLSARSAIVITPTGEAHGLSINLAGRVTLKHFSMTRSANAGSVFYMIYGYSTGPTLGRFEDISIISTATNIGGITSYGKLYRLVDCYISCTGAGNTQAVNMAAGPCRVISCYLQARWAAIGYSYQGLLNVEGSYLAVTGSNGTIIGKPGAVPGSYYSPQWRLANCTLEGVGSDDVGILLESNPEIELDNVIFKNVGVPWRLDAWSGESAIRSEVGKIKTRDCWYYGYVSFAKNNTNSTTKTRTEFEALGFVDALRTVDGTDPQVTNGLLDSADSPVNNAGTGAACDYGLGGEACNNPAHPPVGCDYTKSRAEVFPPATHVLAIAGAYGDKGNNYTPTLAEPSAGSITSATAGDGQVALVLVAADESDVLYVRWRKTGGGAAWEARNESFKRTGSGSVTVTGLTNADHYEFCAESYNGYLYGVFSAPKYATPTAATLAPAHVVSLPLHYLKETLAGSAAFQAWVGAENAEAAKLRIHPVQVREAHAVATIVGGAVTAVALKDGGGGGYEEAPAVTIAGNSGGAGASVTAAVSGGEITGFTVVSGGSGYTRAEVRISRMPFALVDWSENFARSAVAGGSRNYFNQDSGSDLMLLFRSAILGADDDEDAAWRFLNAIGQIMEEVEELAGQAGYLDITSIRQSSGASRPTEEEVAAVGDFYQVVYRIGWQGL